MQGGPCIAATCVFGMRTFGAARAARGLGAKAPVSIGAVIPGLTAGAPSEQQTGMFEKLFTFCNLHETRQLACCLLPIAWCLLPVA